MTEPAPLDVELPDVAGLEENIDGVTLIGNLFRVEDGLGREPVFARGCSSDNPGDDVRESRFSRSHGQVA